MNIWIRRTVIGPVVTLAALGAGLIGFGAIRTDKETE